MKIDPSKVVDIEIDGIDSSDYPDFCDAYISNAYLDLGEGKFRELTQDEISQVESENPDWLYRRVIERVF